jgi:hypothetical protein
MIFHRSNWHSSGELVLFFVVALLLCTTAFVHATSSGRLELGVIDSVDGEPAICLPRNVKESMSVGWASLTQSYKKRPDFWSINLKKGGRPMILAPGECMVYGVVPEGYELSSYKGDFKPLRLKLNRVYNFQLNDAYRPTDVYSASFCIALSPDGTFQYLQYGYLPGGGRVKPPCDSKRGE